MRRLLFALIAVVLVVAGCAPTQESGTGTPLSGDLAEFDTRTLIDHLDRLPGPQRPTDLVASVRPAELVVSDGVTEDRQEIPDDEFYLAFAPYVERTHDCFYHSLTTCQGELPNTAMHIRITDTHGEVLVDEARTTFDNGFIGVWLPRDITATLEVEHEGRSATTTIGTGAQDPTCLTTLQLR